MKIYHDTTIVASESFAEHP